MTPAEAIRRCATVAKCHALRASLVEEGWTGLIHQLGGTIPLRDHKHLPTSHHQGNVLGCQAEASDICLGVHNPVMAVLRCEDHRTLSHVRPTILRTPPMQHRSPRLHRRKPRRYEPLSGIQSVRPATHFGFYPGASSRRKSPALE